MKILKNGVKITSYVLLTALFFAGGYAVGTVRATTARQTNDTVAAETAATGRVYFLSLEDGMLNLYRISGGEREVMASESITERIYPSDDVRELKNGIVFDNLPDAQAVFEDFVS